MTKLTCAKCGKEVSVENGEIKRSCACNSAVIAHMTAHAKGSSSMAAGRK
jgi:hypothetical protein